MYNKLKGKRTEKGYSQRKIAKVLGISANAYNQKENGAYPFKLDEIYKLLKILECKFEDIF